MSEKKGLVQEFKEFLTTGDLMSIAVAFIMGLAVKGLIDSFVKDIWRGATSSTASSTSSSSRSWCSGS